MDRDFSTPQKLLECPHGHASHLPGLAEGQLALLEQMASSRLNSCGVIRVAWTTSRGISIEIVEDISPLPSLYVIIHYTSRRRWCPMQTGTIGKTNE